MLRMDCGIAGAQIHMLPNGFSVLLPQSEPGLYLAGRSLKQTLTVVAGKLIHAVQVTCVGCSSSGLYMPF